MYVIKLPSVLPANASFDGKETLKPQDDGNLMFRCATFGGVFQRWVCYSYPVSPSAELENLYNELGGKAEYKGLIDPKITFITRTLNGAPTLTAQIGGWLKAEPSYVEAVHNFKTWANKTNFQWNH